MLNTNIFNVELKNSFILHIPHSSTHLPFNMGFDEDLLLKEIQLLTDWNTEEIFSIENIDKIVAKFSRVFCDVERLSDADEEMFLKGRGFFYTHTDSGKVLRENINNIKEKIYKEFYLKHHEDFADLVSKKLEKYNSVNIIDCHSFSNKPFLSDLRQEKIRPDICIGTDEFHTPTYLLNLIKGVFINAGLTVEINYPYKGSIVPMKYYKKDNRVNSIMIEINRNLYMKNNKVINSDVKKLNKLISKIFDFS